MPPQRFPYLYEGTVTKRDDPDGLGRIKLTIPGLIEPETPNWVEPIGAPGGGHAQRGHIEPPRVGANVAVMFKLGEIDYPRYMYGAWGMPSGVSDAPTNSAVEDDDRQNAVTEDEEWRIERDSRSSGQKYLIRHKGSSQAVLIDADNDKIYITRENATEQLVLGNSYRSDETSFLFGLLTDLAAFTTSLGSAIDPAVSGAAGTLGTALATALTDTFVTDSTKHLSDKAYTE